MIMNCTKNSIIFISFFGTHFILDYKPKLFVERTGNFYDFGTAEIDCQMMYLVDSVRLF